MNDQVVARDIGSAPQAAAEPVSRGRPIRTVLAWILAGVLALFGAAMTVGGFELARLGGSPYYLLAGPAMAATAFLAARRDRRALRLYAVLLLATSAWAVWEAGFDGWRLTPRLLALGVFGLALGWVLPPRPVASRLWSPAAFAVAALAAALLGLGLRQLGPGEPADPMFAAGPEPAAARADAAPAGALATAEAAGEDWLEYGGGKGGARYSQLDQLTPANVAKLEVAWTYRVGMSPPGPRPTLEVTPLKVGERLYLCTGYSDVVALDAETGREVWRFRAKADLAKVKVSACRGVSYFRQPGAAGPCAERILTATVDARLIALDAASGRLCAGFGEGGQVSLLSGLGEVRKGYYYVTSAPAVVRGKVVLGGWVSDGQHWGEPSGVIRAYDAATGKFAWAFDMGRPDDHGEPAAGQSYTRATPNSWAPMSADDALGMVYVPTGNATPDYFGGQRRPFDDKYSSSVLALDAETGAVRWSFQTAHHDLWDYDVASQPTLIDLPIAGGVRKALIQPTKRGDIFLLDRTTGEPLAPVVERPVSTRGAAPGERIAPTQPFSAGMPSFRGPDLDERSMWGVTPLDQLWCRIKFRQARYDGTLTPPGLTPSINMPGYLGGVDWGGVSVDPARGLMFVNSSRVPVYIKLITRAQADAAGLRPDGEAGASHQVGGQPQGGTPYAAILSPFLSPLLAPCNAPPFGLMTAVDLSTRQVVWSRRLGTARDSGPLGLAAMAPIPIGLPNIGGSVATRGGLVFIAASQERTFRAFDARTGRELWSARLPAGGQATPMTYWSKASRRQFVVLAAGGHSLLMTKPGDTIVAYALPGRGGEGSRP